MYLSQPTITRLLMLAALQLSGMCFAVSAQAGFGERLWSRDKDSLDQEQLEQKQRCVEGYRSLGVMRFASFSGDERSVLLAERKAALRDHLCKETAEERTALRIDSAVGLGLYQYAESEAEALLRQNPNQSSNRDQAGEDEPLPLAKVAREELRVLLAQVAYVQRRWDAMAQWLDALPDEPVVVNNKRGFFLWSRRGEDDAADTTFDAQSDPVTRYLMGELARYRGDGEAAARELEFAAGELQDEEFSFGRAARRAPGKVVGWIPSMISKTGSGAGKLLSSISLRSLVPSLPFLRDGDFDEQALALAPVDAIALQQAVYEKPWIGPSESLPLEDNFAYLRFNLAVSALQQGDIERTLDLLGPFLNSTAYSTESLALRGRARLVLAAALSQRQQYRASNAVLGDFSSDHPWFADAVALRATNEIQLSGAQAVTAEYSTTALNLWQMVPVQKQRQLHIVPALLEQQGQLQGALAWRRHNHRLLEQRLTRLHALQEDLRAFPKQENPDLQAMLSRSEVFDWEALLSQGDTAAVYTQWQSVGRVRTHWRSQQVRMNSLQELLQEGDRRRAQKRSLIGDSGLLTQLTQARTQIAEQLVLLKQHDLDLSLLYNEDEQENHQWISSLKQELRSQVDEAASVDSQQFASQYAVLEQRLARLDGLLLWQVRTDQAVRRYQKSKALLALQERVAAAQDLLTVLVEAGRHDEVASNAPVEEEQVFAQAQSWRDRAVGLDGRLQQFGKALERTHRELGYELVARLSDALDELIESQRAQRAEALLAIARLHDRIRLADESDGIQNALSMGGE